MVIDVPAPTFKRFERVTIKGIGPHYSKDYRGGRGTVVWLESTGVRRQPASPDQWLYVVHVPSRSSWNAFFQYDLESEGGMDAESAHVGRRAEISFDTILEDDNVWVEGSYRLPGEFWKVVIFGKEDVPEMWCRTSNWQRATKWEGEVPVTEVRLPKHAKMGRAELLRAMTEAVGHSDWAEVAGPDSMMLR